MAANNRRGQVWIDPQFQGRYLRQILQLELLAVAATVVVSLALAFALISPDFRFGIGWRWIFGVFAAMIVGCSIVLIWLGVRVSHKMSGPVYRMRQDLAAIREGRVPRPIRLRKGDAFQELAEDINKTIDFLKQKQ
jgi:hypothetical protein